MKRRDFLKKAGVGAVAASTVFGPVFAQTAPTIRWRLASSFPKSLDTIYGAAEVLAKRVSELTNDKFQIRAFPAGEIVPAFQVLDAAQQGTVECGHTAMYYYVGKSLTMAFDTSLPFGLNARQQNAWLYYGGGVEAVREFLADFNVTNFPGGNTGAQMGGWWRKEVNTVADLKGIKFRIPGIGGQVWARLGMVPQAIPGGEIYQSLERGTIDGAEWVGPYDDEKLGLYKIAKFYYYPGWWEPGPNLSFIVNNDQWKKLPKDYQAAFEAAAAEANVRMLSDYDAVNPAALQRLTKAGVKLRKFSNEILKAAQSAAFDIYEEESGKNPSFKKIYTPWKAFRDATYKTMAVHELPFEQFAFAGI
jgi:TRAP-type mannitol/chloroaromatic compound transport system substrate-binding protein